MQLSITGHHVDLTDALKEHVEEKLQHLKHSFDHVVDVHVVMSVEKYRHRCEINMQVSGINIHASKETEDMYASIDGVVGKLNRQLKRYRGKLRSRTADKGKAGRQIEIAHRVLKQKNTDKDVAEASYQPLFDDHRTINASPMSVDDAVMHMELEEKRDIIFFTNVDTDTLNVLYRRQDGGVSWIEPKV
ncbi:MAG: ribosome-associated translation inhibitor RaiA [Mariprofundaceae bacterium]|nr:ribosome-associated translation inhibitor RaiA [Mariprofundaceae bacterium]